MPSKRYVGMDSGRIARSLAERRLATARYVVEHRCTIRKAAADLSMSSWTVWNDLHLVDDPDLRSAVAEILARNMATRHIRGGESTRLRMGEARS
jgi:putative DeoR family transcriptional regulator (stage III sporulation protein D)